MAAHGVVVRPPVGRSERAAPAAGPRGRSPGPIGADSGRGTVAWWQPAHPARRHRRTSAPAPPHPTPAPARPAGADGPSRPARQPISVLFDRVLVQVTQGEGERRSRAGILIPATAQLTRRLTWAEAVAVGPHVRAVKPGDKVLFNPEDRFEVEVQGRGVRDPARARHPRRGHRAASTAARGSTCDGPGAPRPAGCPWPRWTRSCWPRCASTTAAWSPRSSRTPTAATVLTVAYMNAESLRRTLDTGRTWFWSRSRQEFWCKGETSGDRQYVREVRVDCDGDALVVAGRPARRRRLPHQALVLLLPHGGPRARACRARRGPGPPAATAGRG